MPATPAQIIVIATRNPGKLREFRRLLAGLPFRLLSLDDAGIDFEVEETGDTFAENARLKAERYFSACGELTLSDDSGLEVDALDGAPGVRSARFARDGQTDEEGRNLLLSRMAGVAGWERRARYRAVIALTGPHTNGVTQLFEGVCEGAISHEAIGDGGFGYDPVFWLPAERRTMAELSASEKDAISHRGAALRKAIAYLEGAALGRRAPG